MFAKNTWLFPNSKPLNLPFWKPSSNIFVLFYGIVWILLGDLRGVLGKLIFWIEKWRWRGAFPPSPNLIRPPPSLPSTFVSLVNKLSKTEHPDISFHLQKTEMIQKIPYFFPNTFLKNLVWWFVVRTELYLICKQLQNGKVQQEFLSTVKQGHLIRARVPKHVIT